MERTSGRPSPSAGEDAGLCPLPRRCGGEDKSPLSLRTALARGEGPARRRQSKMREGRQRRGTVPGFSLAPPEPRCLASARHQQLSKRPPLTLGRPKLPASALSP